MDSHRVLKMKNPYTQIMKSVIPEHIKQDWDTRGYSLGVFRDPPGQVWADFVHRTDELVVLAEGEIEMEIEDKAHRLQLGEEVFIPANAVHTVRNVGQRNNVWYYGYKSK